MRTCVPPPGTTELGGSNDRLKEHAENKQIAHQLGIAEKTVKMHRGIAMDEQAGADFA